MVVLGLHEDDREHNSNSLNLFCVILVRLERVDPI